MELEGLDAAVALLERARREAAESGDAALVALSHIQESNVRGRVADWPGSLRALERVGDAEPLLTATQRAALHINRGMTHMGLGDLTLAAEAFGTARDLAADHGLAHQEFKARHDLACLAFVEGDLPRALGLMRDADAMDVTVSRDRARLDHAEVLLEAGLVDAARALLADALDLARREGHRLEEGEISLRLARCDLLVDDLEEARRHVRKARSAYRARQADELVREADLIRATIDVAGGRDLPTLVTELAGQAVGRSPVNARAATRLEAEARLMLGDVDGAERRLAALDGSAETSLAAGLHETLVRARLDQARGRRPRAADRLAAGNRLLAAHQFQSASLDVRAAMALHGRRLAALDVERALAEEDPDGLLTTVERWRAISHRITPVTSPDDPELAALTRELRRLRQLHGDAEGAVAAALGPRIAALEAQVAHREWSLTIRGTAARSILPVGAEEARSAVAERGSTVVEFVEAAGEVHQVVLTARRTEVAWVGSVEDVLRNVHQLRRDLRARASVAAASPMAEALERATASSLATADRVLNPSGAAAGRVVVVPSHSLAAMPWSLMPSLRGRPVTVAPSLTRWVRGPVQGATSAPGASVAALHGPGLARSGPEVRAVRAAWGLPEDAPAATASSRDVVGALGSARVVHLAAHGIHERQSPLFSSVRMSDGPVFAHEFPRPVAAEHVALSACDVGQFSTRPGDEPLGLAIALLSLGATSVLAAVAPVADDVAHDAMVAYHRMLAAGADAAEALAVVVEGEPAAGVFCLYGSDWSLAAPGSLR